jgi:hypothetical protein
MKKFIQHITQENNSESILVSNISDLILKNKNNTMLASDMVLAYLHNVMINSFNDEYKSINNQFFINTPCTFIAVSHTTISNNIKYSPKKIAILYLTMFIKEFEESLLYIEELNTVH